MGNLLSVSEVAARLQEDFGCDVPPKVISDLIYRREIPAHAVTTLAGRRLVKADCFGEVIATLRRRGRLPALEGRS